MYMSTYEVKFTYPGGSCRFRMNAEGDVLPADAESLPDAALAMSTTNPEFSVTKDGSPLEIHVGLQPFDSDRNTDEMCIEHWHTSGWLDHDHDPNGFTAREILELFEVAGAAATVCGFHVHHSVPPLWRPPSAAELERRYTSGDEFLDPPPGVMLDCQVEIDQAIGRGAERLRHRRYDREAVTQTFSGTGG